MSRVYVELPCRECHADRDHRVLGWNGVGKPVVRCLTCDHKHVGPLGCARPERPQPTEVLVDD